MAGCPALNCTFLDQYQINSTHYDYSPPLPPTIVADPDIAGLGVILAFLSSAYVTWVVVAIGYGCGYVDDSLLGNLDRRLIRIKPRQSDRWGPLLVKVVLILSDQQIVTGLSILAAGYAKRCTINVYHWQVIVYLAWMSSGTHLITLTVLRTYLREKHILRAVRVVGMLILFVMLCIAIVPTGSQTYYSIINNDLFDESFAYSFYSTLHTGWIVELSTCGVPSACFWHYKYWNGWRWDAGLSLFLLVSNYTARAAALFESSEAFFNRNIRERLLEMIGKALDRKVQRIQDRGAHRQKASCAQLLSYRAYLATYAVTLASLEFYSSFLAPLLWVLLNLVWGSLQLLNPRMVLAKQGQIAEENTFGFGQIMPLMLLALPLVAAFDAYYEAQKPPITQSSATSSPQTVDSQTSDPLVMTELPLMPELPPMKIVIAGQMIHGQDDDAAPEVADAHLVRADTEHLRGNANHVAERTSLGNFQAWTPHSPERRSPPKSLTTSKACLTWRAHHQDFYASKWFRSILIFIICSVITLALVLYVFASPALQADIFSSVVILILFLPGPVGILLFLLVGGMRFSRIFQ